MFGFRSQNSSPSFVREKNLLLLDLEEFIIPLIYKSTRRK